MRVTAEQLERVSEAPGAALVYRDGQARVESLDDASVQLALRAGAATVLLGHDEAACLRIAAREESPDDELETAARLAGERLAPGW